MTPTPILTDHLTELADTLDDLRRRFRQAAREEVARAVGEALRQVALSMIGGSPRPVLRRAEYDSWDDPWQDDPVADSWDAGISRRDDFSARERPVTESTPLHPAVIAGLWAAWWGLRRTRQPLSAIAVGLGVGLAALAGGPTIQALLAIWSTANDLLHAPEDRRPRSPHGSDIPLGGKPFG